MPGLLRFTRAALPELQSFAQGVERDKAAVQAGLTLSINNGQVEGQVTRIKLLKRMQDMCQMTWCLCYPV